VAQQAKPVTIVLIDDRKCDAWGNCQVQLTPHFPSQGQSHKERRPTHALDPPCVRPVFTCDPIRLTFPTHSVLEKYAAPRLTC
jgi:hypothetical protein